MTTIAYRDGILAADSRLTYSTEEGGGRKFRCAKIFRKTIGRGKKKYDVLIATAGESSPGMVFVDWYGSKKPVPDVFLNIECDFTCLILTPDGLFEADRFCRPDRILERFYAVGSGCKEALAAMHCGRGALQAVEIAGLIDPYTAPPYVWDTLKARRIRQVKA